MSRYGVCCKAGSYRAVCFRAQTANALPEGSDGANHHQPQVLIVDHLFEGLKYGVSMAPSVLSRADGSGDQVSNPTASCGSRKLKLIAARFNMLYLKAEGRRTPQSRSRAVRRTRARQRGSAGSARTVEASALREHGNQIKICKTNGLKAVVECVESPAEAQLAVVQLWRFGYAVQGSWKSMHRPPMRCNNQHVA